MTSLKTLNTQTADRLLKATLVLSRAVEQVLERGAVQASMERPLSASKVQVLAVLAHRSEESASRLAHHLGVTKAAVTQLIDAMVRERLVRRRRATHDRREAELSLTQKGEQRHRALRRRQRHLIRSAVNQSPRADVERWTETLREITAALAQAQQAYEGSCLQCGAFEDASCVLTGGAANCLAQRQDRKRPGRDGRRASTRTAQRSG